MQRRRKKNLHLRRNGRRQQHDPFTTGAGFTQFLHATKPNPCSQRRATQQQYTKISPLSSKRHHSTQQTRAGSCPASTTTGIKNATVSSSIFIRAIQGVAKQFNFRYVVTSKDRTVVRQSAVNTQSSRRTLFLNILHTILLICIVPTACQHLVKRHLVIQH